MSLQSINPSPAQQSAHTDIESRGLLQRQSMPSNWRCVDATLRRHPIPLPRLRLLDHSAVVFRQSRTTYIEIMGYPSGKLCQQLMLRRLIVAPSRKLVLSRQLCCCILLLPQVSRKEYGWYERPLTDAGCGIKCFALEHGCKTKHLCKLQRAVNHLRKEAKHNHKKVEVIDNLTKDSEKFLGPIRMIIFLTIDGPSVASRSGSTFQKAGCELEDDQCSLSSSGLIVERSSYSLR
ncbi:hypothetical protein KC354_g93 [Hortaea werneckii]|nr:hypothetical protein KC354_g93 [Hortaea werneckii]